MSDSVLVALIATVPAAILALANLLVAITGVRKVEEVRHETNSMKDQLVETTAIMAHAAGVKEERARMEAQTEAHEAGVQEEREARADLPPDPPTTKG